MKNEVMHTANSNYRCEYHIVFAPKYRRKIIYKQLKADLGEIMRKLCKEMKVEIIEAKACPDHIHMLVSIPPYLSVAEFGGTLKSKSALMIFDRHANLKYKYTEGCNNKTKVLKRVCFGVRNFNRFRNRILHCAS